MQGMTMGQIMVNLLQEEAAIEKINKMPIVRTPMKADQVAIRIPRLIGTELTVSHGKLREADLAQFAELCVGMPTLVGHQKDTKPVARCYDAWVSDNYVFSPFYLPLGRSDTADLLLDIDSGVISEVSASFAFDKPMCNTCNLDMRSLACGHLPGKEGNFFWYDTIQRVLEQSLVYRGGHPNTGFISLSADPEWSEKFEKVMRPDEGLAALISRSGTDKKQLYKQLVEQLGLTPVEVVNLITDNAAPREALVTIAKHLKLDVNLVLPKEELMVPGLTSFMNRLIDEKAGKEYGPSRLRCIASIASYADMAPSDVEAMLASAKTVCPTVDVMKAFARALDCSVGSLIAEAKKGGCKYNLRAIKLDDGAIGYR